MTTHTEHLAEIIERVRVATETLGGDDSKLRAIAFQKLLDHELSHTGATNGSQSKGQPRLDTAYATETLRAEAIARYFDIVPDEVQKLFDISNDTPRLRLPRSTLSSEPGVALREIALLICGARTVLNIETGTVDIAGPAEEYGCLDDEFIRDLTSFDLIAVHGKPTSANRLVRMRVIGAEAARSLAHRLLSDGE